MAAPKAIKNLAGDTPSAARLGYGPPSIPFDPSSLEQAVVQLQNSVNALIAQFNAHYHVNTVAAATIWDGGVVIAHVSGLAVDVAAGDIHHVDGTYKSFAASANLALATADITNPRIDLVQVHATTGVITKKDGTAAGSPVAPSVDAGNLALATVRVNANATTPTTITDARTLPAVEANAAPAPALQVDGTAKTAQDLFTAS